MLAIRLCRNEVDLAFWWGQHEAILRRLDEPDWAAVWRAKKEREAEWEEQLNRRAARREPQPRFNLE